MPVGKDRTIGAAVITGLTVIIAALITVMGPDVISGSDSPEPEPVPGTAAPATDGGGTDEQGLADINNVVWSDRSGLTVSGTGFLPGEEVGFEFVTYSGGSETGRLDFDSTATANETGGFYSIDQSMPSLHGDSVRLHAVGQDSRREAWTDLH
jgi:hypothetical protein